MSPGAHLDSHSGSRHVDLTISQALKGLRQTSSSDLQTLNYFTSLLESHKGPWPVFDLILSCQHVWASLPEEAKSGNNVEYQQSLDNITSKVKSTYGSLAHLLPSSENVPALLDAQNDATLSHGAIRRFVEDFDLGLAPRSVGKPRVVVALPNGPLLGLACMAVSTYYTMAPMTTHCGADQFRHDVEKVEASAILVLGSDVEKLELNSPWVSEANISVFTVQPHHDMTFSVSLLNQPLFIRQTAVANTADDIAILLFTSGTSGDKKLVPIPTHTLVAGVAFVIDSWGLTAQDRCLNMMPLNHVGGIVRNLFAPVMAGGSTICCSSFDPNLFWDLVENRGATWYYASPSMHTMILAEAENRPDAVQKSRVRIVCNAAGGLLPTLATQLRSTFDCTVLPSYGMTECMPIATPPLDYRLDRPGTSGISIGPGLAILNPVDGTKLPPRTTGNICVRGAPVFPGYLKANNIDTSVFTQDGWFDTGDMGYMDEDGYLYITGRSKEVINRGGEIISPFEVEEAILSASKDPESCIHGRVSDALAFSVPHEVLQEVVGIVIVTSPGKPSPDLRQIHEAVRSSLDQPKWPFLVAYMDGLPKAKNKVLRIKLGDRLGLETVSDSTEIVDRYVEAECPPLETPLTTKIPSRKCSVDLESVSNVLKAEINPDADVFVRHHKSDGLAQAIIFNNEPLDPSAKKDAARHLEARLRHRVDGILVPSSIKYLDGPKPLTSEGTVHEAAIDEALKAQNTLGDASDTQRQVQESFASILGLSVGDIDESTDFFAAGGDSLRVGRLLSSLRAKFGVRLKTEDLFTNGTISAVSALLDQALAAQNLSSDGQPKELPGCTETYSSTHPLLLIIHLIPIALVYPLRLSLQWTIFLYIMASTANLFPLKETTGGRLLHLMCVVVAARIAIQIVAPVFGVLCKWLIIGRYKEGMYPMWGPYHTRWWLTQKILQICGKGIYDTFDWSRKLYWRSLGIRMGRNVTISNKTSLGEYDLIEIGDNAVLDRCICRPFAAERNTSMFLGRIKIGKNSSVGIKSIIAPGATVPDNTCIGPNSSSWEMQDADENNRELLPSSAPQPHWLLKWLIIEPINLFVIIVSFGPWLGGMTGIASRYPRRVPDMTKEIVIWYTTGERVAWHYLARVCGAVGGPIVIFGMIVLLTKLANLIFGRVRPGPSNKLTQVQKLRQALIARVIPDGGLAHLGDMFGSHYEIVSVVVRALGGKVGKRVYWPGVGPSVQNFDLIDVGNDVVFGSRAHLITSDGYGNEKIKIGDGAMIADRAVVLPGTTVGERTVLGSGALTRRNHNYPKDTVWVGSKGGSAVCLTASKSGASVEYANKSNSSLSTLGVSDNEKDFYKKSPKTGVHESKLSSVGTLVDPSDRYNEKEFVQNVQSSSSSFTAGSNEKRNSTNGATTPFGRAFYEGKADYHVIGMFGIFLYSTLITMIVVVYWNVATVTGVKVVGAALQTDHPAFRVDAKWRPLSIYAVMLGAIACITFTQAIIALAVIIASKWILLGRRRPGDYDWDKSSYCQRWQLFLTIEKLRRRCYTGRGIIGLLTGTHYAVLYFRLLGANIGKDCALFANGRPALYFTEPDLLTLGDRVTVDDASLVGHINSRGNFKLHELYVGDRSVLRTGSRLLAGANMSEDACLLEHTLVMSGDHVDAGVTYQGWPASVFTGKRV